MKAADRIGAALRDRATRAGRVTAQNAFQNIASPTEICDTAADIAGKSPLARPFAHCDTRYRYDAGSIHHNREDAVITAGISPDGQLPNTGAIDIQIVDNRGQRAGKIDRAGDRETYDIGPGIRIRRVYRLA